MKGELCIAREHIRLDSNIVNCFCNSWWSWFIIKTSVSVFLSVLIEGRSVKGALDKWDPRQIMD